MRYEAPDVLTIGEAAEVVLGANDGANDCCTCGRQLLFIASDDDEE